MAIVIPAKETLYKTAFSPLYDCFIAIVHAHTDSDGGWIYTGLVDGKEILFRPCELTRICL